MTSAIDPIVAALQVNDATTAERLCRQRLEQEPDAADVLVLLALSLWRTDRRDESLATYERLTKLYPDEVLHWRNHATALRQAGDLAAAAEASASALKLEPDDAEWLDWHGTLQMDLGQPDQARDTLLRAFGRAPESPAIRIHAARACSACRDARAESLLRPWRTWMPVDDQLQSELAEALKEQGNVGAAVELLEDLARRLPAEWRVRLRLAGLYERINRLDEADGLLRDLEQSGVLESDPAGNYERARQRARLAMRRREYAAARELLEGVGPRSAADAAYDFDLAQTCDKLGDTKAAMQALARAHTAQVDEIKASHPSWFAPGAKVLPNQNKRVMPSDYAGWPDLSAPTATQSPLFVVGFPRSGTTLLEQMLDAHPRLQSMDERPFLNMLATQLENSTGFRIPEDLGRLDQRDCDELRKGYLTLACGKVPRRWDAQLVDKNPMNMLWLSMIYRLFPDAKFILAIRHPCDVLLSCYMQNFMSGSLAVVCETLETLATAYVDAMDHWLHHVRLFEPDVFVSRYEDLVADPALQTSRIAGFLGLEDARVMLDFDRHAREKGFIATPSYTQVIEPINTRGIGRWLRYRDYFTPVLPILEPMLDHWGYTVEGTAVATEH